MHKNKVVCELIQVSSKRGVCQWSTYYLQLYLSFIYLKLHILDNCTYPDTVEHLNTVNLSLNLRIAQATPAASFLPLFSYNFGRKSCKLQARNRGQRELRSAAEVMEKWRKRMPAPPSCHFCQESASNRCSCLIGASTLLLTRAAPCRSHQQHGRRRRRHRQSLSAVIGCRATWLSSSFLLPATLHYTPLCGTFV